MTQVDVQSMPAVRVLCMRHIGPYADIGRTFRHLWTEFARLGIAPGDAIAVFHDDPAETSPEVLRSDAAFAVPLDFQFGGGLKAPAAEGDIHLTDLPSGLYAVFVGQGAQPAFPEALKSFQSDWGKQSEYIPGLGPSYEIACSESKLKPTAVAESLVYIPVARVAVRK